MENAHQFDGTGLGLNITKKLVELMDGSIKLSSKLNEGTRVSVAIPAEEVSADNVEHDPTLLQPEKLNVPADSLVLVVEDHYINQIVIKTIFDKLGLPISVVGSGEEGVEYVKSNPVDLVLMDINLPGIDGTEATRQIKQMRAALPVIALTADVITQRDLLLKNGLDDLLTKPVENAELIRVLNHYLGK
jgi:CheY-like chemotaxis protein